MRVDMVNEATGEKLVKYCNESFDEFLIVYENADGNEHYHVHGYSNARIATLRQQFRRKFPENSGNKGYELKECDDEVNGYLRYLAKGDSPQDMPVLIDYRGQYDMDDLHAKYWEEFERENGEFDPQFKRRKNVTTQMMLAEVADKLCDEWFDITDKPRVLALMFDVWQSYGKVLNLYRARDYYYELAYKLAPSVDSKFALCAALTEKW